MFNTAGDFDAHFVFRFEMEPDGVINVDRSVEHSVVNIRSAPN